MIVSISILFNYLVRILQESFDRFSCILQSHKDHNVDVIVVAASRVSWCHLDTYTHSPPIDPATHSISATTPILFRGIFWWVTSLNVSHWSKSVMHVVIFTINNDVAQTSFSQCTSTGRPTDWLANSRLFTAFSHELSQIALRHYTQNVMNIVVCAITNNWMANNARKLHIWYNFLNRTMKQNGT